MGHYTKLAVIGLRCIGLLMLVYSLPMFGYGVLSARSGAAAYGASGVASVLLGWGAYALAGFVAFLLAEPLARIATRGIEPS